MTKIAKVEIGSSVLYNADCRELLDIVKADSVITDPPYGVGLTGKSSQTNHRGGRVKRSVTYSSYDDTSDNFEAIVLPALHDALGRTRSGAVFMAERSIWKLPPFVALGGIYSPAGTGLGAWGFQCFMHCAFYGRDPYLANGMGSRPNGRYGCYPNDANQIGHPCAKPIQAMLWAVDRASLPGETVLDPFAGSGTTGVACIKLGRRFVGIEIEPAYFDIACRRIEEAQRQGDLLNQLPPAEDPADARMADLFTQPEE